MDEIVKEGYTPIFYKRKKKILNPLQKRKNRLKYLKNKSKLKRYNQKWRQKNKMVLRQRRKIKHLLRRK